MTHDHKPDAPSRAPLDKDDNRVEEAEANARLIAAAPELLAALKIVREKSYLPTHCAAIIDAALAKAEGGSHA